MEEYRLKYGTITDMLRARFPGIRVWDPTGPGQGICIRNQRGSTSWNESSFGCALMLIDGLEADPNTVAILHPEEIEAIQYISRIEARLAWGERGRYGVLLIETRRGGRYRNRRSKVRHQCRYRPASLASVRSAMGR